MINFQTSQTGPFAVILYDEDINLHMDLQEMFSLK